ncbi:MAG: transcription termination factor Rho [Nocardioides sp.]|nr:transcription termination factor Rho [Nocardioides sp.]
MTETNESAEKAPKKRAGGLNAMLLADLKAMAGGMGVQGAGSMKKAQLVEAIKAAQAGAVSAPPARERAEPTEQQPAEQPSERRPARSEQLELPADKQPEQQPEPSPEKADEQPRERTERRPDQDKKQDKQQDRQQDRPEKQQDERPPRAEREQDRPDRSQREQREQRERDQDAQGQGGSHQGAPQGQYDGDGDGEGRTGRNRRRRGRDRNRVGQDGPAQPAAATGSQSGPGPEKDGPKGGGQGGDKGGDKGPRGGQGNRHEPDTTILEDDVVVPAAGILDVLDNYAFVRTSGYLPGTDDVYLSLSMVRKFGLRRGDAIVGQVRHPREGERREKFNPMVRIDSVNALDPETAKNRAEFHKLTPLSPSERLRLETDATNLVGRVIDLAAPIGKGQRGLIVSPPKAGKTKVLQSIAASISTPNPECHLMVVLIDERPEEVTEFERSVKGEVIASTFDRPATDHTTVAELAIERAKRLVELGHDVVVLLDGLTRLGRAYNLTQPGSGRILSGAVDAAALHPPRRFFGAARNVENGGSLTILATALVETGSTTDEIVFEEFRDTANMELRLSGELAARRLYPAVDVAASGTRREELLLGDQELSIVRRLRQQLASLERPKAHDRLLQRLRKSHSNIEFLTQLQKSDTSGPTAGQEN